MFLPGVVKQLHIVLSRTRVLANAIGQRRTPHESAGFFLAKEVTLCVPADVTSLVCDESFFED